MTSRSHRTCSMLKIQSKFSFQLNLVQAASWGGDLECQQALVDLGSFQPSLTVSAGCVCPSLIPRQVNEGKLSMHLPPSTQDDLKHGVAPRRVSIRRGLTGSPGGDTEKQHKAYFWESVQDFIQILFVCCDNNLLCLPAAVSHFDEFEDVLCAFHLPLLQPHHLHLLLPVLQDS